MRLGAQSSLHYTVNKTDNCAHAVSLIVDHMLETPRDCAYRVSDATHKAYVS